MDLGPAYAKTVRARAPQAMLCFDPFHVVKLATDALDGYVGRCGSRPAATRTRRSPASSRAPDGRC